MTFAFATIYDLRDIRRGSGTYYSLAVELERQGHRVHRLGPFEKLGFPLPTRLFKLLSTLQGKRYRSWQDPFIGRRLGQAVRRKLEGLDFDVLLTNDYTIAAYTRPRAPCVLYTDDVFPFSYGGSLNPRLANLSGLSVRFCQRMMRLGLRQASLCYFPADWIVKEALNYRQARREQMGVIPFGANLEAPPAAVVAARSGKDKTRGFRLLFVGKDWVRKGGDVAVAAVSALRQMGIHATLDVAGGAPAGPGGSEGVVFHGLLDKSLESGRAKIHELYCQSDALILPSLGEGFVIAALEAAAYGLPVLAYSVAGVVDAVVDGQTGVLLPKEADASQFAQIVAGWLRDPRSYERMCLEARRHFDETCNWSRAARLLAASIQNGLAARLGALKTTGPNP